MWVEVMMKVIVIVMIIVMVMMMKVGSIFYKLVKF